MKKQQRMSLKTLKYPLILIAFIICASANLNAQYKTNETHKEMIRFLDVLGLIPDTMVIKDSVVTEVSYSAVNVNELDELPFSYVLGSDPFPDLDGSVCYAVSIYNKDKDSTKFHIRAFQKYELGMFMIICNTTDITVKDNQIQTLDLSSITPEDVIRSRYIEVGGSVFEFLLPPFHLFVGENIDVDKVSKDFYSDPSNAVPLLISYDTHTKSLIYYNINSGEEIRRIFNIKLMIK